MCHFCLLTSLFGLKTLDRLDQTKRFCSDNNESQCKNHVRQNITRGGDNIIDAHIPNFVHTRSRCIADKLLITWLNNRFVPFVIHILFSHSHNNWLVYVVGIVYSALNIFNIICHGSICTLLTPNIDLCLIDIHYLQLQLFAFLII